MSDLLKNLYSKHPGTVKLYETIDNTQPARCHLKGLSGSSASMLTATIIRNRQFSHLCILNDKEEAAYFFNDLESFCPGHKLFFFPSSFKRTVHASQEDPSGMVQRTALLESLAGNSMPAAIVTYPEAITEKVIPRSELEKLKIQLITGETISRDFLVDMLNEYGFTEKDFVYEPGEFAIRGSIVDVFSYSCDRPYRIDFFGNEVESIRIFDIESQLSEEQMESVSIIPDIRGSAGGEDKSPGHSGRVSVVSMMDKNTLIWVNNPELISARIQELYDNTDTFAGEETVHKSQYLTDRNEFINDIETCSILESGQSPYYSDSHTIAFSTSPQPAFNKNFELLTENLAENINKGYTNYIFSENEKQFERLKEIFSEIYGPDLFQPVLSGMYQGFTDHDLSISCYTDHQIFERYHKFRLREGFKKKESVSIKTLHDLRPGDYVVHIDHGIGKFGGLERIDVHGKTQEALKLVYKDGDTLYVSIHSLHRISKYKGKDGIPPKIYKLGTGAWQKIKQRTKNKVKDIARELITLYAKRKMERGFGFSPDSYMQRELEASFIYEDTPDQIKATGMVKEQMESTVPMDILVCGDVGFGKTEVAVRAAFKAAADNKQVAVLVPTTILALQHFNTFSERLKDFPVKVEHISRLRSPGKQKEILAGLASGEIDIIIGTHRIIGKDVKFKDMGLLVIDEEQKFGVGVKEKLKKMRLNVDTLTLTATPIPRTLQFSLMGARDLAIINTPPPNRHPIITELHSFNTDIIREAIEYEVQRGGQIFYIHNRVQNIAEIEGIVNKACPGVRTAIAHGQMDGGRLEKIMLGFISGEFDVLIATTIIESGLDIPNANTIIINNAHHFGLSDLHQLRGRVGRSNKKAFCYLLAPPPQTMTREARQRLKAIEDFSDLGSGFNIAMQDLDIRGAGNLLGSEQSGFIADIGFETYHRILDEAVQELRETEFKDVFSEKSDGKHETRTFIRECQVDTDMELLFPEEYIPGNAERIKLYRILDNITDETSLERFETDISDRFGPPPFQTKELLDVVRLRRLALSLGFEKIILKSGKMLIHFISNQLSPYYQSPVFAEMLSFIQKQKEMKMKEQKHKLTLSIQNINTVGKALEILKGFESRIFKVNN
ncbi:MAG: transcription-repair coupling factor [Bacteroidales bacterium]